MFLAHVLIVRRAKLYYTVFRLGNDNVKNFLFLNINQLDALNFISLFQASTCFEHMCSSPGGQKLYYTVSGIITPMH